MHSVQLIIKNFSKKIPPLSIILITITTVSSGDLIVRRDSIGPKEIEDSTEVIHVSYMRSSIKRK